MSLLAAVTVTAVVLGLTAVFLMRRMVTSVDQFEHRIHGRYRGPLRVLGMISLVSWVVALISAIAWVWSFV